MKLLLLSPSLHHVCLCVFASVAHKIGFWLLIIGRVLDDINLCSLGNVQSYSLDNTQTPYEFD